jgi:transmembrane sensor
MDNRAERARQLIEKYITGKCTPEEQQLVETWYNRQAATRPDEPGDVDMFAWQQEIYARLPQARQAKVRPLRWISAAAAVLLVSCLALFWLNSRTIKTAKLQYAGYIQPGGNKAILTLANGRKISLNDAANGRVAEQSGVVINKTGKGQLTYQPSGKGRVDEFNTIEAPIGGQWKVILPDGSLVFLNAASRLRYPTSFTNNERRVELSGEAYFEISHNKSKPFRVSSQGQIVEVLGTHFNVTAYAGEPIVKTTLFEGAVKVTHLGETQFLKPGQQALLSKSSLAVTSEVDLEDVLAWQKGYFKFNERLETIMQKIARWYNVKVVYDKAVDVDQTFSGEISRSRNIADVLNIISASGSVHFKLQGRSVTVFK